jgi:succinate dehydrogenase / fumarate reductase flavoprotein subunit
MMDHVGVFREGPTIESTLHTIRVLKERFKNITIDDKSLRFNTDLYEAWELGCLLDLAEVTAYSALGRTESRGAHYREDFPKRDDANWLKHTFVTQRNGTFETTYKPVVITKFQPKERTY